MAIFPLCYGSTITKLWIFSPVRSVMIVAPGDPIPAHLPPQQQLQLQQLNSDHHRPPSEVAQGYFGWQRPILKRSCSLCDCHQIVREKRNQFLRQKQVSDEKELLLLETLQENHAIGNDNSTTNVDNGCENNHFDNDLDETPEEEEAGSVQIAVSCEQPLPEVIQYDTRL